ANFDRAGLDVDVILDDCGASVQERFDLILCNPPFHHGFSANRELTERFLTRTSQLLAPQGLAMFVVNQFIPLETVAADYFGKIDTLAANNSFKVIGLTRPRVRS